MTRTERNVTAHQQHGLTAAQAESLETIMADAERRIAALLDAGDLGAAQQLATDTEAFVLATFA